MKFENGSKNFMFSWINTKKISGVKVIDSKVNNIAQNEKICENKKFYFLLLGYTHW